MECCHEFGTTIAIIMSAVRRKKQVFLAVVIGQRKQKGDVMILITNNADVAEQWKNSSEIVLRQLVSTNMLDVLYQTRDLLHKGHWLLTHPFTGSLKPNENPYKSVLVSEKAGHLHLDHVATIEQCIASAQQSLGNKPMPGYAEKVLKDFRLIDQDLIGNGVMRALESHEK